MAEMTLEQQLEHTQYELAVTQEYLKLAIDKLPRKELKVTLETATSLDTGLKLQGKADDKGNLFLRTVKRG